MKIAIVGAGAMGSLYGAKLSTLDTNEVFLIDVWQDHVDAINTKGLDVEEKEGSLNFNRLKATSRPMEIGLVDLAIVFVKSTLTAAAMETNKSIFGPDTIALTLQNGLGNVDIMSEFIGEEHVLAGTTAHGATMIGPGNIRHAGIGKTIIGELSGEITPRVKEIVEVFNLSGLETVISENVNGLVWDKLLVNVGINALTGITGLENGRLLDYPEIEELLELAVGEAIRVAEAKNIHLSWEDPIGHTKDVCRATAANKSSMLQDVLNGKQTEIDMINGAILREGLKTGVDTPINLVLTNLIRHIQRKVQ